MAHYRLKACMGVGEETSDAILLTVQDRDSCNGTLIGNCMWPIACTTTNAFE